MRQDVPRYRRYFVVRETQVLRPTQTGENIAVHDPANRDIKHVFLDDFKETT